MNTFMCFLFLHFNFLFFAFFLFYTSEFYNLCFFKMLNFCLWSLQAFSWTTPASILTSLLPAAPSLPRPPCSSWRHSSTWTKRRGRQRCSTSPAPSPTPAGPPQPTLLPAAATAASPQRGTETRAPPTGRSTSPTSEPARRHLPHSRTLGQLARLTRW